MVWDWELDGWIVLAGALAATSSAVLGCLLLLRRMSLLADAISHSVLPGIAAAFLFTGQRTSWSIFIGAALTGLLTVWLTELIHRYGRVEESAAIGIVFTSMFAFGLVLIVQAGDKVDLDPSCILYGNLETSILDTMATPLGEVPRVVVTLAGVLLFNGIAIGLFFKEWQITTFDPAYAQSQGIPSSFFHYLLASLVAVTCIAAFEAVGNILVVAVIIIPAAISFLMTTRLATMIWLSVVVASLVSVVGHTSAIWVPSLFGMRSVNSAAMMSVIAGVFLGCTILFSPKSGYIVLLWRQRDVSMRIRQDDVLAMLFREQESVRASDATPNEFISTPSGIATKMRWKASHLRRVLSQLVSRKLIEFTNQGIRLTELGECEGQNLVRSHRLWERYLSTEVKLPDDKLHPHAESWEHYTSPSMRGELDQLTGNSTVDPHGKSIPPER